MQPTIRISGKLLGRNQSLFPDWHLSLDSQLFNSSKGLTLGELLTEIIQSEVEAFRTRQEQRKLISLLSPEAIQQGVLRGKIEMGGQELSQEVNIKAAIERALQAFEDGLYYVFLDDEQIENLEQPLQFREDSQLLFLRLVPLVGG
jgi:hypothetical protein